MPALFTTMSMRSNSSRAACTIASAPSGLATLWWSATATPPAARISSTTAAAPDGEEPLPSTAVPRSLTTTAAPRDARSSAWARPSPAPAPVTSATRSWKSRLVPLIGPSTQLVVGCEVAHEVVRDASHARGCVGVDREHAGLPARDPVGSLGSGRLGRQEAAHVDVLQGRRRGEQTLAAEVARLERGADRLLDQPRLQIADEEERVRFLVGRQIRRGAPRARASPGGPRPTSRTN